MKKSTKKAAKRSLNSWRIFLQERRMEYAEAYFVGVWDNATDAQAVYILTSLTRDEMHIIMDYPIWM